MANTTKTGVALKLSYDLGIIEDKQVTKTRTIQNIRMDATEEQLLEFAEAMLAVQSYSANIAKLDTVAISA